LLSNLISHPFYSLVNEAVGKSWVMTYNGKREHNTSQSAGKKKFLALLHNNQQQRVVAHSSIL